MDESEHSAQLLLPAVPARSGAQVIALPLPARPAQPPQQAPLRKTSPLWYALYFPQLPASASSQQDARLRELAGHVTSVSSTVSYHPRALVAEIRSSLKYFGGLEALHRHLQQSLQPCLDSLQLDNSCCYAAAPTVTGSLLLARAGYNGVVYRPDNLRSALGRLPYEVLHLDREQNRRLYNMGVRELTDLWRLPMSGLRKRFGSDLVNQLHKALGKAPEPTRNYLPPPAFETSYDLPYGVENLQRLLPVADEMLAQLCDFLRRRDLATDRLVFALCHENRAATRVTLGLRQPGRARDHLLLLLETRFARLTVPAPVCAMKLEVLQFDAFNTDSEPLLRQRTPDGNASDTGTGNLDLFMEQLRARLGGEPLKTLQAVAEHCPEYACRLADYDAGPYHRPAQPAPMAVASQPRPLWLLAEPVPLTLRGKRLYYRKAITLISGPERIETRWWSGTDVRRDYYVATETGGSRLWIFRERSDRRDWYLHGIFA